MVLISHRFKFIYIKNMKVAGTSIEAYFEKYCMDPNKDHIVEHKLDSSITEYGIVGNREGGKRTKYFEVMGAQTIKKYIGDDIFNSYFKFCAVRNPYDKMVSLYHMMKSRYRVKYIFFDEFVKKLVIIFLVTLETKSLLILYKVTRRFRKSLYKIKYDEKLPNLRLIIERE